MDAEARITELENQLEEMRGRLASVECDDTGQASNGSTVTRRGMLGLAGTGMVGAAIFGSARPAAAGVDGDLVLETDNPTSLTTSLSMTALSTGLVVAHKAGGSTSPSLAAHHEGMGVAVDASLTSASNPSAAIAADTPGTGVAIDATAPSGAAAVRASSTTGFGVDAASADSIAVKAASISGTGAEGRSETGDGLVGIQDSSDPGVAGIKAGVRGISAKGPAVVGESDMIGVQGVTATGVGVDGLGVPGGIGVAGKGATVGVIGVSRFVDVGAALAAGPDFLAGSVTGVSDTATGVVGRSVIGTGVHGRGDIGVIAEGTRAPAMLIPSTTSGPPTTKSHVRGQLWVDKDGNVYACTGDGTPGTWSKINDQVRDPTGAGGLTAGPTFLPTPQRAFDSRAGRVPTATAPGPKGAFTGGETRTIDLRAATDVPSTATAISVNLTVTNTQRDGYVTVYSAAAATLPRPTFSSINWSASGQNVANAIPVACDADQRIKVFASGEVDVLIDALGYFL